jgi:hypothetical protein
MPLWRRGLRLALSESPAFDAPAVRVDEIEFDGPRVVHLMWVNAGLQFEWVLP